MTARLLLILLALPGLAPASSPPPPGEQSLRIAFQVPPSVAGHPCTAQAIQDASGLLAPHTDTTQESPQVWIVYHEPEPAPARPSSVPLLPAADPAFSIRQEVGQQTRIHIHAASHKGLADATYALLQEGLGFAFIHPEQTLKPSNWPFTEWPLKGDFIWQGAPRFHKQGFHLHTMHPTELTEALHDPHSTDAWPRVKAYIDWLARNGQNYFDYSLMEGVDGHFESWAAHMRRMNAYAASRDIITGIDLSIHMLQQKSYQLVHFPPKSFRKPEEQLRERLGRILETGFTVINLEFALAEFVGGMEELRDRLRQEAIRTMAQWPGRKIVGRQHVVKPDAEIGGKHDSTAHAAANDPEMGLLVHTVMCYALEDSSAPVYELDNFAHLHQLLKESIAQRETWYYPESAYWITFDNSIPLYLLPYLGARWRDIQTAEREGAHGHLTFSSGWEWGYWLIDWSIARWCWRHTRDGAAQQTWPTQYLEQVVPNSPTTLRDIHDYMERRLVQDNLLAHLCPSSPSDELPRAVSKQFQPRPNWRLPHLRRRSMADTVATLQPIIHALITTADSLDALNARAFSAQPNRLIQAELGTALTVTTLRMRHRAALYRALIHRHQGQRNDWLAQLRQARTFRSRAKLLVLEMEMAVYRYPAQELAGKYDSHTAYEFGYLYPVHKLHFWEREERQLRHGRTGPFYRNIYNMARIAGILD